MHLRSNLWIPLPCLIYTYDHIWGWWCQRISLLALRWKEISTIYGQSIPMHFSFFMYFLYAVILMVKGNDCKVSKPSCLVTISTDYILNCLYIILGILWLDHSLLYMTIFCALMPWEFYIRLLNVRLFTNFNNKPNGQNLVGLFLKCI